MYTLSDTVQPATLADANEVQAINTDIASALTGSVASDGQTPITGQLRGFVSANPGYSFNGDLNTGFGSDVADQVYVQAGGTKTVRVTATGMVITGNLSATAITNTWTITGSTSAFIAFQGISTNADAVAGPILELHRNSASPAASDRISAIQYFGQDSGGNKTLYAEGVAIITDPTNGSEDGEWAKNIILAGVLVERLRATAAGATTTGIHTATSFTAGANPTAQPGKAPTYQIFTSGAGLTYNTAAGATWLRIRGGGAGGGGAGAGAGGAGGATIFNSVTANGGAGGINGVGANGGAGGAGGTGGAGAATLRLPGGNGQSGRTASASEQGGGGIGGVSPFGGGGTTTVNVGGTAASNSASGGGGGSQATNVGGSGGGGAGEYFELIIPAPAASYIYTVGTGGTAGAAGGGQAGGAGGAGRIIVEEFYS